MGFSITGDLGPFSILALVLLVGAGVIMVTWLLAAARQDRRDLKEQEGDAPGPDL